jgi:HEAT repeat protein
MKRYRPLSGAAGCVSLAIFLLCGVTVARDAAHWITSEEQDQIVKRLRAVLPAGSVITATSLDRTPDDWYTLDSRGFEVEGHDGEYNFRIWFLPRDWIGIRRFEADRPRLVYWEGVLLGSDYKTVTDTDSVPIYEAIERLGMSTPSLVNSGWDTAQELYKNRLPEVAEQVKLLITRFCKDDPCKEEAAYSLIVLGVPTKSITMDCAEHATGRAQEFCVSALGYWKGQDSVRVLERVISNPASTSRVQNYAAIALEWIADPSAGPTLLKALHTVSHPEAAAHTAAALERIRYAPAAPEILAQLEKETDPFYRTYYAKALATLRYQPAVPAIQKLCKTTDFSSDLFWNKVRETYLGWSPEIALLRLTAPWGQPSGGIRLLLLPPIDPRLSAPIQVTAVIENVGDKPLEILATSGDVIVDGMPYSHRDTVIMDGNPWLRVNDVDGRSIDLTGLIIVGGLHHVEYRLESAISNQLILNVGSNYR